MPRSHVAKLHSKRRYVTPLLPLAAILVCIAVAETTLRLYHLFRWNISVIDGQPKDSARLSPLTIDTELGWRATENYQFDGMKNSYDGKPYAVKMSQDAHGFRGFAARSYVRPRVFIVGDSFTQAADVSDDKTYYAVLARLLDVSAFAYGGGGYGTLQEWLIFDKYLDVIRPDLILWQYSTNDIINNSHELETASRINNNGLIRPYWVNDRIEYILPKHDVGGLHRLGLQYCRICYVVLSRLDRLGAVNPQKTVETDTGEGGAAQDTFRSSVDVTAEIIAKVRRRAASVPVVAFIVGLGDPYGPEYEQAFKEISRRNQITFLDDVDRAVLRAEQAGEIVRAADGAHWNETGHRIAGQAIAAALKKVCLVNLCG